MADNDVKIKVSLDGAEQVQKGLNGIGAGASDADSKLGSMVSGGLKGAGVALVGFATAAAAAGGALAASVVNAYASAEQSVGGIETLFKGSADQMKTYAADAYKTAGLSANEYMEQATSMSASLIQSVGGDTAKAAELANTALISMSDNANKMGTNLGDIQNAFSGFAKQNYTMLDNLKLGYGGTQAEMQRLLSDAEKLPAAMGQKFDISNYGDVVTAIQLIQEEMGIAGTTAKEASSTISGSVGMLKGSFDNLLVAMGSANNESLAFLNVQEQAANVISSLETVIGNVVPVIESIGDSMGTLGPQLGTMMQSLVGAVSAALPAVLNAGVALIGGLIQGITSALPSLITALVPGIIGLVQTLAVLAPQLITAGAQAVSSLVIGIGNALPSLIPAAISGILGMVQALISAAPMLIGAGLTLIEGLVEGVMEALPLILAALPTLIQGIVGFISTAVPAILQAGITLFNGIVQALPEIISQLVAVLPQLITAVIGAITGAVPLLVQAGITLLTSLVTALPEIITTVVAALPQIITAVLDAILGAIPLLIQAGIDLLISLIGALPQIIVTIVSAIPKIITGVINAIVGAIPQLIMAGVQLLVALVSNMPAILGGIIGAIPQIISGIVGAIIGAVPQLMDAGVNLVRGLWNGIADATGWLINQIGGFVDDVMGAIGNFFGIASPSKRMRDEIGDWIPAGIGVGVQESEDDAIDPITDMNKKIMKESMALPDLIVKQSLVAQPAAPIPLSYTTTQVMSLGTALATSLVEALQGMQLSPEVTATIDPRDMNMMARTVGTAMQNVRAADGREAALSVQQGAR